MTDIDDTFDSAKARGFKLQTLMQFGETSWMACFIPLNPKGSDAFYYGRGADAATALRDALARHDTPYETLSGVEASIIATPPAAAVADDDLFGLF